MCDFHADRQQLSECLHSLLYELRNLSMHASHTSPAITQLQQRSIVLERYFIALHSEQKSECKVLSVNKCVEGRSVNRKSR